MNPFFSTHLLKKLSKMNSSSPSTSTPPASTGRLPAWFMYVIGLLLLAIVTVAVFWYHIAAGRA